ncbi:MAG: cyclic nucleotide-binding domain-containing protein [Dehalococcoidia bacterium]
MDAKETLKKVPIFAKLEDKHLKQLAGIMVPRKFAAGDVVVKEGDAGAGVFLISSGQVEVVKGDDVLNTLGPGEFFGEMSLFEGFPRSATVRAMEDTECLAMTRWDFRAELSQHAEIAVAVLETVVRRLREADVKLSE